MRVDSCGELETAQVKVALSPASTIWSSGSSTNVGAAG
jgi:hypothetical protein